MKPKARDGRLSATLVLWAHKFNRFTSNIASYHYLLLPIVRFVLFNVFAEFLHVVACIVWFVSLIWCWGFGRQYSESRGVSTAAGLLEHSVWNDDFIECSPNKRPFIAEFVGVQTFCVSVYVLCRLTVGSCYLLTLVLRASCWVFVYHILRSSRTLGLTLVYWE